MKTEVLPFVVHRAAPDLLLQVCELRATAYGRRDPMAYNRLKEPDEFDLSGRCPSLVAVQDQRVIGTVRLQTSPLAIETCVELPELYKDRPKLEMTRLAIAAGSDKRVRLALMKACYLYAVLTQSEWMVIGARSNTLIAIYEALGFTKVFDHQVPLSYAGNARHTVLSFNVTQAPFKWKAEKHPLLEFMTGTYHPSIDLK